MTAKTTRTRGGGTAWCTVALAIAAGAGRAAASPATVVQDTDVRIGPAEGAPSLGRLASRAEVCVLDGPGAPASLHRRGWVPVALEGGLGYVRQADLRIAAPAAGAPSCARRPVQAAGEEAPAGEDPSAARVVIDDNELTRDPLGPLRMAGRRRGAFEAAASTRVGVGLGGVVASVSPATAMANHLDSSGLGAVVDLDLTVLDVVMGSLSLGGVSPHDNAAFSEVVVSELGGDPQTASSDLSLGWLSLAGGLHSPWLILGANAHGWVSTGGFAELGMAGFSGKRSISNCTDCRVDTLSLPSGAFWRAGVELQIPHRRIGYTLRVAYTGYLGDAALGNAFQVSLSCWFRVGE